jgi:hypothetical protein
MPLVIDNTVIERVEIVDDDPDARDAYRYNIIDMKLVPVLADKPKYNNLNEFISIIRTDSQAAICDYHLSTRNYASFNGGEAVAELYRRRFPAILCTRFYKSDLDNLRSLLPYIPVLLTPNDLEPETIEQGFRKCIEEFNGQFRSSRQPWRTLVRIEEYDKTREVLHVVIPAWDANQTIGLQIQDVSNEIQQRILEGHEHFHAQVNLGAETYEDLYFTAWEPE